MTLDDMQESLVPGGLGHAWLEDLGGKFKAKLREVQTISRPSSDGKTTTTFKLARVESSYDAEVVQKLAPGQLLAIPNVRNLSSESVFSIFEIADVIPMHYSMLSLNTGQPGALRGEFMGLIDKEWKQDSRSTWIEIVASPTGYISDFSGSEVKYERKYSPLLVGSNVRLLNKEAVRRFVCYVPDEAAPSPDAYSVGNLLGVIDNVVPFTINFTQLINFHTGVFCHTGGGKSYLTSMVVRKALRAIVDLKVVVFDVSSEYGILLLDQLATLESRVLYSRKGIQKKERKKEDAAQALRNSALDFYKRQVKPDALVPRETELKALIEQLFRDDKCKAMYVRPHYMEAIARYRTYEGLLDSFANTVSDRFNANQQASIYANDRITTFLKDSGKSEEEALDRDLLPILREILEYFAKAGVKQNSTLYGLVKGLEERLNQDVSEPEDLGYSLDTLVRELMDDSETSPRLFVIDEEIEVARDLCSRIIGEVFRQRRSSFNLRPRILFVFDEAQEFVPAKEDARGSETLESSKAVERLLRHGRKYHLHGWISTQRLAHLNTSALHQIHSYFVGTLPRPYDRQLVGDTFAIDDALLERTLNFSPGDWLLASYRATNTQNVPVFFHAVNNEDLILPVE